MPITLNCPKCHKPFRVRDESIGGRVRCPSCGAVLQVPAALSPASHFGTGDDPPGGPSAPSSLDRPSADDSAVKPGAGPKEPMLGGAGRGRDDAVDLGPPGGRDLPAPPSIKGPARAPVRLPPTRAPAPPTMVPSAPPRTTRAERKREPVVPLGPIPADASAWRSVSGGLGLIRFGLFLFSLVFLGAIGHAAWIAVDYENAMKDGPGFLGKEDWPRWKELLVAYTAGPIIPGVLLLLLGRLRCAGAPRESHAGGLALGAAFFTFVAILAAVVYGGLTYFDLANKLNLNIPAEWLPKINLTAQYAIVPAIVSAEVLTLLFIGQIGWPLARPYLQRGVAGLMVYALVLPAGILIAHLYYPAYDAVKKAIETTGSPLAGGAEDDTAQRALIWGVILLAGGALLLLRYAGVAGSAKRAIRKYLSGLA